MQTHLISSWNVNSLNVRQPQVLDYLNQVQPDVLGLQELKQTDAAVRCNEFSDAGWHIVTHGQKTYNGVALISRQPLADVDIGIPHYADSQARVIAATYHDVRIINVYVPNGKAVGDEKYAYKLEWLHHLQQYIANSLQQYRKLILMGDFNIAPQDIDVHDPEAWRDKILCSTAERDALNALCALGMVDAFRTCHPETQTFSWWDYRRGGLRRNIGLRIDLNLCSHALELVDAGIHMEPRHHERPSDHAPAWVSIRH